MLRIDFSPKGIAASSSAVSFLRFFPCLFEVANMDTFTPKGHIRGPIMPIQILKSCELSLGAKILYNALIYFAGEKNFCWAAHSTLAKFICCSVSSIKNYLNELRCCSHEILAHSKIQRICTAARNELSFLTYRVAIPRQRLRLRKAFSTK